MEKQELFESGIIGDVHLSSVMNVLKEACLDSTCISALSGTGIIKKFEDTFARKCGARFALGLSSCTAALHTALLAAGIGSGDEVIVSSYSWGQSVAPVLFTGATAVFADISPATLTLDPISVEDRISGKTKAIIPVHLFGNPADMDNLCALAKEHSIHVISDAAQAFGAFSKGKRMGALGHCACFSLGRGKGVFGGEGGVLVTNDRPLYEMAAILSQHPLRIFREVSSKPTGFIPDELNWNYRIHPLATALGLADLKLSARRIAHRKRILDMVINASEFFSGIEAIRCSPGDSSAAYGVPLTYHGGYLGTQSRESFVESLQALGIPIGSGPVRVPIHLRSPFQKTRKEEMNVISHPTHMEGSCPVAERRCREEELQIFDANSLDRTEIPDALKLIKILKKHCESLAKSPNFER